MPVSVGFLCTAVSNESQKDCHSRGLPEKIGRLSFGSRQIFCGGTLAVGDDWVLGWVDISVEFCCVGGGPPVSFDTSFVFTAVDGDSCVIGDVSGDVINVDG